MHVFSGLATVPRNSRHRQTKKVHMPFNLLLSELLKFQSVD